jgi:drug/metabolite transporter superfamily protein YnfA
MNPGSIWFRIVLPLVLALLLLAGVVFSASVSASLARSEEDLQANAISEPQAADPLQTYVEVALPKAHLPLLSSGYMGIAPSIHLIRLSASLPLSNIDPIENAARRRFGRVDLSFAILAGLPLAALLMCVFVAIRIGNRKPGKRLWDFAAEHIALPLSAWFAFCFATLLSAQYAFGLRLESNEAFLRMAGWTIGIAFYAGVWLLVFLWLLLRLRSAARAALAYCGVYVVFTMLWPGLLQSAALAAAQPEPRIALTLERRERTQFYSAIDLAKVARMQKSFGGDFDFESLSVQAQQTLTAIAIEQELGPRIDDFLNRIRRFEALDGALGWLSPVNVTRALIDDLAGTGARRYASFREQSAAFSETWRQHMLPKLLRRQALDYDDLRSAPKFRFQEEAGTTLAARSGLALAYLLALGAGLALLALREYRAGK